jgi:hypothetical protein
MSSIVLKLLRRVVKRLEQGAGAPPPDHSMLNHMVWHVAYEMVALEAAGQAFRNAPETAPRRFAQEAFLLHVRNLRDFFWGRWNPHSRFARREIYAEHYYDSPPKRAEPEAIKRTRKAIHWQLAHITTERRKHPRNLDREMPHLERELQEEWSLFLSETPSWRARFIKEYDDWQERFHR